MKKWNRLDKARTPDGKALVLEERDGRYTIRVDGTDLMSTHQHSSEEKLAELACAHIAEKSRAHVLIGGLGFGFTLRAVLASLMPDAKVVVAEIMEAVIAWNSNPAYGLALEPMQDPRVQVIRQDVLEIIKKNSAQFDSLILDVDNGATALSTESNRHLYRREGLLSARAALKKDGRLAVWSAVADEPFAKLMAQAGFQVESHRCRAHVSSGGWHTVFLGRKV